MSVQELSEKSSLLEQRHFPVDPPWRDLWASVLFGFHLCALLALTIYGSLLPAVPYVNGSGFWLVNWLASLHGRHFVFVLLLLGCSSCISLCWGLFLIALLRGSALAVIYISCIFSICFALAMTIYWFVVGPIYVAVVSLLLLLGTVLFLVFGFKRIPFTAILLSTVSVICKQYPGLLFQNLVSSLFWLCYLGLFIAASVFSARIVVLQGWHLIPLLLAFFWTQQVTQNFAHVTASGIVGCWYFREQNENPTLGALYRAATSSFGSICFGSLIVGLIKTFDAVCRMLLMANHEIISFFVRLLLSLIERLVEWFNTYAFTYCAIYGLGYVESAKRSWKLLLRRFGSAIINDSLVSGVTMMASFCGGSLSALVAVFMNWPMGAISADNTYILSAGFVTGFCVCLILMQSIEAAVTTIFVCLAEDPYRMKELRPSLFEEIAAKYPDALSRV